MKEFVVTTPNTLIKTVLKQVPALNYNLVLKTLRKKDIKINGVRINKDVMLNVGDKVQVYANTEVKLNILRVYEDENILIVNKPTGIEVVGNDNDLVNLLKSEGVNVTACHRIDVNTEGLVLFAKNQMAENIIFDAFKNKAIKKYYLAWVSGKPKKKEETLNAYLQKDANASTVKVFNIPKPDAKPITTIYKVLEEYNSTSLLMVQIPTGKTHQIRAHLSFVGHPIVGDEKYGDKLVNKKFGLKKQCLTALKLELNFGNSKLSYLNGKTFQTNCTWLKYTAKDKQWLITFV